MSESEMKSLSSGIEPQNSLLDTPQIDHTKNSVSTHRNVFLSWAHTGRDWTVQRQHKWKKTVIEFARLLDNYVDVEADFFRSADSDVDWTRYGPQAIKRADMVVVVGNDPYWERWEGQNPSNEGAGAAREADALHGLFDRDQRSFQTKVVIVLLPDEDSRAVPYDLVRVNQYTISTVDLTGIEFLLRRLLSMPEVLKKSEKLIPQLPSYYPRMSS